MKRLLLAATLLALLAPTNAHAAAPVHAGGGRVCETLCLRKALVWQKHERSHLALELARAKTDTPAMTVAYACEIGEVVYHVRASHCELVVRCESQDDRHERNSATASGFAQYEDATWASTAFAKAGFSVYDTVPAILAMDSYAAVYGFDTSGGWAASYGCHHLRGPEA